MEFKSNMDLAAFKGFYRTSAHRELCAWIPYCGPSRSPKCVKILSRPRDQCLGCTPSGPNWKRARGFLQIIMGKSPLSTVRAPFFVVILQLLMVIVPFLMVKNALWWFMPTVSRTEPTTFGVFSGFNNAQRFARTRLCYVSSGAVCWWRSLHRRCKTRLHLGVLVETAGKSYDIATSQPWFNRCPNRIQTWQWNMACSIIELDGFLI